MTITEFLEARIAEDEAAARAAAASNPADNSFHIESGPAGAAWTDEGGILSGATTHLWDCEGSETLCTSSEVSAHMARHDPARVLAECAAKRAIITLAQRAAEDEKEYDDYEWQGTVQRSEPRAGDAILLALAAVYKDHPDYQQEWVL